MAVVYRNILQEMALLGRTEKVLRFTGSTETDPYYIVR